jgi:hypothetical protein
MGASFRLVVVGLGLVLAASMRISSPSFNAGWSPKKILSKQTPVFDH